MTYGAFTSDDFASFDFAVRAPRKEIPQAILCTIALAASVSAGCWLLYSQPLTRSEAPPAPQAATAVSAAPASPKSAEAAPATPRLRRDAWMFDPQPTTHQTGLSFAQVVSLRAGIEPHRQVAEAAPAPTAAPVPATEEQIAQSQIVEPEADTEPQVVPAVADVSPVMRDVPLPLPRPAALASTGATPTAAARRAVIAASVPAAGVATSAEKPSFFSKLFGDKRPPAAVLAYAPPESTGLGGIVTDRAASYERTTAIYDISAHTVYLPDGTKLEAHSGLGARLDDPNGVNERMRGATPPNVYNLSLREAAFHGVRALRLTPVGTGNTYGRAGLLAHTFMLGPRGDSNGCVVFRNYKAFLEAYESGQIRRLVVVPRLT